jgi:flagellar motor switch protein FliG
MQFKGGVDEAVKMLQGLGASEAKNLLNEIRKKDPRIAALIEERMIKLEDLAYCSAAQLVGLLRDVNLEEFGLALRIVEASVVEKLMGMVSTGIRMEIEDGLKGKPRRMSEVEAAQAKILAVIKKKIEQGQLVLDKDKDQMV